MRRSNESTPYSLWEFPEAPDTTSNLCRFRNRGYPGGGTFNPLDKVIRPKLPHHGPMYEPEWHDPRDYDPSKDRFFRDRHGQWRKRDLKGPRPGPTPKIKLPPAPWHQPPGKLFRLLRKHPWFRLLDLLDLMMPMLPWGGEYDTNGWNLVCDTGLGPHVYHKKSSFNPGLSCGLGGQVPDGGMGEDITREPFNMRWVAFGRAADIGTVGRMFLDQQWSRSIEPLDTPMPWRPRWRYLPDPKIPLLPLPWFDPPWPFGPFTPPAPPFWMPPHRQPGPPIVDERTHAGNRQIDPGRPPPLPKDPDLPREPPRPRPPDPYTKEKKTFGPVKRGILEAWDAATEVGDTIECLLDTVPKKVLQKARLAHKGRTSKAHLLWLVWDHVDAAAALDCVLENHYTDKLVGAGHRLLKKAGLGVGFGGTPYRRTSATGGLKTQRWRSAPRKTRKAATW